MRNTVTTGLYGLAWGVAIGATVAVFGYGMHRDRTEAAAVAEATAAMEARITDAESRADRIANQIGGYKQQAEPVDGLRQSLERANNEAELALQSAEGWSAVAAKVAIDWEAAFIKYESERRVAALPSASPEEVQWMNDNPPEEMARKIRPVQARALIGSKPLTQLLSPKENR